MRPRMPSWLLSTGALILWTSTCTAVMTTQRVWEYQDPSGAIVLLPDERQPALYTGNFGDCLGSSKVQLDRFDASLYKDNMTVNFHFSGQTNLTREDIMVYIGVFAYGESRFDLTFNPCGNDMKALCPIRSSVAIEASGQIPLALADISNIPDIAYSIPDFEGQAVLRIFANSTQTEIGCYSAQVTNGATFSQSAAVGSILGIFTIVAILASFATAIYGDHLPTTRTHYAHSLSILVVFAVYHHIFFTGALSMNWPSVLVSWWSNFAWSAGILYIDSMQNSIDRLVGRNVGNTTLLGAAGSGTNASSVAGGYNLHTLYRRFGLGDMSQTAGGIHSLSKRALVDTTSGFKWYGQHVQNGLPLPGNYSGFAGTLAVEDIAASNAFLTSFLWFLILVGTIVALIALLKISLEILCKFGMIKTRRLAFFRSHWRGYAGLAILRTCLIAFFAMSFLTIFQFTYSSATGPLAIAAVLFAIITVGIFGLSAYAIWYRVRGKSFPVKTSSLKSPLAEADCKDSDKGSATDPQFNTTARRHPSWWGFAHIDETSELPMHEDEDFIKRFGWLASRFRSSRWWFFIVWSLYEFVRACFYGGASGHAMVQVFGLLAIETLAFIAIIKIRPFEGQRLNLILVYLLGFSKVITLALSAAFDIAFQLPRITTTAIGIVIIVVQGLLVIALLVAIVVSAFSSWMSVTRHHERFHPRGMSRIRDKYFQHLRYAGSGHAPPQLVDSAQSVNSDPEQKHPFFTVKSVKRMSKIEDEDPEFQDEISQDPRASSLSLGTFLQDELTTTDEGPSRRPSERMSRAFSMSSQTSNTSLPYAARLHRGSWITREFAAYQEERTRSIEALDQDRPMPSSRRSLPLDLSVPPVPTIPDRMLAPAYTRISLRSADSTDSFLSDLQRPRSYQIQPRNSSKRVSPDASSLGRMEPQTPTRSRSNSDAETHTLHAASPSRSRTPDAAELLDKSLLPAIRRSPSDRGDRRRRSLNMLSDFKIEEEAMEISEIQDAKRPLM